MIEPLDGEWTRITRPCGCSSETRPSAHGLGRVVRNMVVCSLDHHPFYYGSNPASEQDAKTWGIPAHPPVATT